MCLAPTYLAQRGLFLDTTWQSLPTDSGHSYAPYDIPMAPSPGWCASHVDRQIAMQSFAPVGVRLAGPFSSRTKRPLLPSSILRMQSLSPSCVLLSVCPESSSDSARTAHRCTNVGIRAKSPQSSPTRRSRQLYGGNWHRASSLLGRRGHAARELVVPKATASTSIH